VRFAYFGPHRAGEIQAAGARSLFLDDVSRSGLLCIGYLGPRLPNTKPTSVARLKFVGGWRGAGSRRRFWSR
jgi:hypothetical protein